MCDELVRIGFAPVVTSQGEVCAYVAGNLESDIAFMAHCDTVHFGNKTQAYQSIFKDDKGYWSLTNKAAFPVQKKRKRSAARTPVTSLLPNMDCLGADDAAGMAIIIAMLTARPEFRYIIHRGEECGLIGASAIQSLPAGQGITRAISFDRAGYSDVITHQRGSRSCSDAFGQWIADELNAHCDVPHWAPSPNGVFTDSVSYTGTTAECTNISVGYFHQHSGSEYLDGDFLKGLTDSVIKLDWEKSPVERDPAKDLDLRDYWSRGRQGYASDSWYHGGSWAEQSAQADAVEDLETIVRECPRSVAKLLAELGYDRDSLCDEIGGYSSWR